MKTIRKTNLKKELQSRPEQSLNTGNQPVIDLVARRANRSLGSESLLNLLRHEFLHFYELAEVVGRWVWAAFPDKQGREVTSTLSQLGFHWNNLRQVWQHPCGTIPAERQKVDPRKRFGSHFAADQKAA